MLLFSLLPIIFIAPTYFIIIIVLIFFRFLSFTVFLEFGRNAQIISYTGNRVAIRKVDGAILFAATSSDIGLLYELTRAGRWEESLR